MTKFFAELKRRNVVRVAGIYAVVGWLLLQIASTLEDSLNLPSWFDSMITATLLIGLPIALLLAWAFEMTPEGVRRTEDATDGAVSANKIDGLLLLGILAIIGLGAWQQFDRKEQVSNISQLADEQVTTPAGIATIPSKEVPVRAKINPASIAVLPFADLSPEKDQEYFSDGIAEEILNVLARVKSLDVASRTSSFQFKGRELGIPEIADELYVRHVLEGSVRKAGTTIRITAQLIDTETDRHLWSETFDRPLTTENVFTIQDEISASIVSALHDTIGIDQADAINVAPATDNLTAYDLFLRARPLFQARQNLDQADGLLRRAVDQDPEFAKAWEMLAAVQPLMVSYGYTDLSNEEIDDRATEYANRALSIDPNSATAIATIAFLQMNAAEEGRLKADYAQIIAAYDRSLEIEPRNPQGLNWRAFAYANVGYLEDALASLNQCIDFEPYYAACRANRVSLLSGLGEDQKVIEAYRAELDSGVANIYMPLGVIARRNEEFAFKARTNAPTILNGWRKHDQLYSAFQNLHKPYPELIEDILSFQQGTNQMTASTMAALLVPLGAYHLSPSPFDRWDQSHAGYRQSNQFKRHIRSSGAYDFWLNRGFPPQCRAVGENDFSC